MEKIEEIESHITNFKEDVSNIPAATASPAMLILGTGVGDGEAKDLKDNQLTFYRVDDTDAVKKRYGEGSHIFEMYQTANSLCSHAQFFLCEYARSKEPKNHPIPVSLNLGSGHYTQVLLPNAAPNWQIIADQLTERLKSVRFGHLFMADISSVGVLKDTYSKRKENPCVTVLASEGLASHQVVATTAAMAANRLDDPGLKFTGEILPKIETKNFKELPNSARNDLLKLGISTFYLEGSDLCFDRLKTLSKESLYADLNRVMLLNAINYDKHTFLKKLLKGKSISQDPRHQGNSKVITLSTLKVEFIKRNEDVWLEKAWIQDPNNLFNKLIKVTVDVDSSGSEYPVISFPVHLIGQPRSSSTTIYIKHGKA